MDSNNQLIHNINTDLCKIKIKINTNIIEDLINKLYINSSNSIIDNIECNINNNNIDYSLGKIYYTPELQNKILKCNIYNDRLLDKHTNLDYSNIDKKNKKYSSTIISPNSALLIDGSPDIHLSIYKFIEFLYTYESKFKFKFKYIY